MLQTGRSRVRFPTLLNFVSNLFNFSGRTMALGFTQPLTEMSTRNFPGGRAQPERKADNLTVIFVPVV
jgi:hypothetical protein